MISLVLDGVRLGFEDVTAQNGERVPILVVQDEQSGIQVRIPFDPAAARALAAHLDGRPVIETAVKLP